MITNYIKTATRSLVKNKVYSLINILGLTLGLACFMLIALYIFDELTFDRFHKDAANISRVVEDKTSADGKESRVAAVAYNLSAHAKADLPEIKNATRLSMIGRANVMNDENTKTFYESFWLADKEFLKVFDFVLLIEDPIIQFSQLIRLF